MTAAATHHHRTILMNRRITTIIRTLLLTFAVTGCPADATKTTPTKDAAPPKAADTKSQHAPSGVVPGSHEDWCGEHAVPESMCTQCDPSLVAAFKATGDWCAEHGLPESQCKLCNPDLKIERPPKTAGAK